MGVEVCDRDAGAELSATPVVERLVAAAAPEGWWLASCRLQAISKRAEKLVAVYRVVLRDDTAGGMRAGVVLAHLHGPRRGERSHAVLGLLREAGLAAPAALRVPRPYGYDAATGLVVHELPPGPTLLDHLVGGDDRVLRAAGEVGRWIARLQMLDVELPPPAQERAEPVIGDAVERLATAYPEDAARLRALGERVAEALASGAQAPVLSQGALRPDDVVVDGREVTVVDVDRAGLREPGFDVGRTVAHLLIASGFRLGDMRPGMRAAAELWRRYEASGPATWRRVRTHAAAGFVFSLHEQLCVASTERDELLVLWPRLADSCLESDGAADLAARLRRW
jgi:hypothetical protein